MKVRPNTLEIVLVTSNLLHNQPDSHARADANWIIDNYKPDIWGAQECEDYHDVLTNLKGGYEHCFPHASGWERQDPIMYNKATMEHVGGAQLRMHGGVAHSYPPRYVNSAHFKTKPDGLDVWYFNTHTNQHVEVGGHPRSPGGSLLSNATKSFHIIAEQVQARALNSKNNYVFWGGDLNVDWHADKAVQDHRFPWYIFNQHGMQAVYGELGVGTSFQGRCIDQIGDCRADSGSHPLSLKHSPSSVHSDHEFVRAVYSIPRRKNHPADDKPSKPTVGTKAPDKSPTVNPDFTDPYYNPAVPLEAPDPGFKPTATDPGPQIDHTDCCGGRSA